MEGYRLPFSREMWLFVSFYHVFMYYGQNARRLHRQAPVQRRHDGRRECHHIGGGERALREMGEKEFVDNVLAGATDAALFRGLRVGGHHDAAAHALWPHRDIGAVVELAHHATLRTAELLVGRQVQTTLDALPIQHGVIFDARNDREACQIGYNGPCPILPIQPREPHTKAKDGVPED